MESVIGIISEKGALRRPFSLTFSLVACSREVVPSERQSLGKGFPMSTIVFKKALAIVLPVVAGAVGAWLAVASPAVHSALCAALI